MELIDQYKANLSARIKAGIVIDELELIFCYPKKKRSRTAEVVFIDVFNKVKKKYRPKSSGSKSLSKKAKNNLKALTARGFNAEDFEKAVEGMYLSDWAIKTANDVPEHLLREEVFTRYLNKYEQSVEEQDRRDAAKEAARSPKTVEEVKEDSRAKAFEEEALKYYKKSLEGKKWIGSPFHAATIYDKIDKSFLSISKTEEIKEQAGREARGGSYRGYISIGEDRTFKDLVIIEAIKNSVKIH